MDVNEKTVVIVWLDEMVGSVHSITPEAMKRMKNILGTDDVLFVK